MKTMKILTLFGMLAGSCLMHAQQLPQFTQYMFNTISVNPAYAGSRETLNVTALHRNQWTGIDGNPRTNTLSIHAPLRNDRIGLGMSYINDRLGFESTNYIYGDFSYTVPASASINLSFGLKAGFTNYTLQTPDPNDIFFNSEFNNWSPNMGAGVYISSNLWYVGISAPRMFTTDLNEGEFEALERTSYYTIAGLVLDFSEKVKFKPTVLSKFTNGAPATYDVTANFLFYDKLWLGASYRFNDADGFGALLDFQVTKDIRLGYAYDLPIGDVRPYTTGTHEVILIYEVGFSRQGPAKSPRYF